VLAVWEAWARMEYLVREGSHISISKEAEGGRFCRRGEQIRAS
jgi:hypothetical protein